MRSIGEATPTSTSSELSALMRAVQADAGWVTQLINGWRAGEARDIRALLDENPELAEHPSAVFDLLYEEFCLRSEAGEAPTVEEYCQRFPELDKVRVLKQFRFHTDADDEVRRAEAAAEQARLAEERLRKWPHQGDCFAGFQLLRELGRGGFARVFLAEEQSLGGRRVVVKLSRQGEHEAQTLAKLIHPNIVPVHSCRRDADTGLTVVCMPYLGTATLQDLCSFVTRSGAVPTRARMILRVVGARDLPEKPAGGPEPIPRVLQRGEYVDGVLHLAAQLSEALSFLHGLEVCHRDLKPSNVLLTPTGRPMLLDFNLCTDEQTGERPLGGTLPYMAPEQVAAFAENCSSVPSNVGARADLFSLGALLYELLTGCQPFGEIPHEVNEATCELLLQRQRRGPAPLHLLNPRVDTRLSRVIAQCLAFDPQVRPSSAAELALAFRRARSLPRRARRWLRLHSRIALGAAALLTGTAIGAAHVIPAPQPVAVRHLNQGREFYQAGRHDQAIFHFSRSLDADPSQAEAFFGRGRAHQQAGNLRLALNDYLQAEDLISDLPTKACIAYCLCRGQQHDDAIVYHEKLIGAGYGRPAVYNNLGYGYLHRAKSASDEAEALRCLDAALDLDPTLGAAHHNCAMLVYKQGLNLLGTKTEPGRRRREKLGQAAFRHIQSALAHGPKSAELCRDAACVRMLAGLESPSCHEEVLDYLARAVEFGEEPGKWRYEVIFRSLATNPRFLRLVEHPGAMRPPAPTVRLVDPLSRP